MSYRLTMSQREVLEALIKLYRKHRRMIKSKEIAEVVGRDEGTVRNIILSLKSLGLVESKTGPTGGYIPTLKAYEVLGGTGVHIPIRLRRGREELDLTVVSVELIDVFSPDGGRAVLRVYGDLGVLRIGDRVQVGPTPFARVVIEGEVTHVDDASGQVGLKIRRIAAIPRVSVGEIATRSPITVTTENDLRYVATILATRNIRGVPVLDPQGRLVGIITQADITRAFAEQRLDSRVEDYMSRPVVMIREDEDIYRAIELMNEKDVGRLVVVDEDGRIKGIVTRTDILKYIAGLAP